MAELIRAYQLITEWTRQEEGAGHRGKMGRMGWVVVGWVRWDGGYGEGQSGCG